MYGFGAALPNLDGVGVEGVANGTRKAGGALLGCNSDIEQPSEQDASEGRYQEIGSIEDMGLAPWVWVFQGMPPDSIDQLMLCDEVQVSGEERKYSVCTQSYPVPKQALSDHYGAHLHLP